MDNKNNKTQTDLDKSSMYIAPMIRQKMFGSTHIPENDLAGKLGKELALRAYGNARAKENIRKGK